MNNFTRLIIVIYVLRMFMPLFGLIPSPVVILMAIYILLKLITNGRTQWVKSTMPHLLVIYLLLVITDVLVRPLSSLGNALYAHAILWVLPFIFLHIYHNNDTKLAKVLLYTVVLATAITAFTTYLGCVRFPGISRQMATGQLDIQLPKFLNIGGFDTIYIFVLMIPMLGYRLKYCKIKWLEKVTILATIIMIFMAVFQSEYTTAIIFSIIAITTLFLPPNIRWGKMIILLILIAIIVAVSINYLSSLLFYLSDNIDSLSVSGRLKGLALMLQGQEGTNADESDVQGRLELIIEALEAFSSSPILGVQKIVGGHSYIADIIAYYGIFGLVMLIVYFRKLRKLFAKCFESCHCSSAVITTEIIYLCFLILNPRLYLIVPFLFLPLFSYYNDKTIKS